MQTKTEARLRRLAAAAIEAAVKACDETSTEPEAPALPADAPDHAWEAFQEEALAQYNAQDDGPRETFLDDCWKIFEEAKEDFAFSGFEKEPKAGA